MTRRISLRLAGAILAPAVLLAFVIGLLLAGFVDIGPKRALAQSEAPVTPGLPTASSGQSPFVSAVEKVIPTVVNISAEKTVRREQGLTPESSGPFDEFFRRFFGDWPELPIPESRKALGSGVIIRPDGYIVTNNHVVAGFDKIVVRLSDDTEFQSKDVKVVGRDPKTDLAVIRVATEKNLPAIEFGREDETRVGDWVIAVGNAFGLQSTVTVGVISAKRRSGIPLPEGPSYQDFIQTDASINPGNSGGALVNVRGELVGINSAIRSPVGANVGVGFAVPVDMVKVVADQLIEHGKVVRGFLGVRPQPVTESIRKAMKLKDTKGVLVSEVVENAPAERAGFKAGDVIVEVDGQAFDGVEQFRRRVADFAPGTKLEFTFVRDGKQQRKAATLTEFPEDEQSGVPVQAKPETWLGLDVRSLGEEERDAARVRSGVVVERVEPGSTAEEAGIKPGDIILEVGEKKVDDLDDYDEARKLAKAERAVLLRIQRGQSKMYVAVELE